MLKYSGTAHILNYFALQRIVYISLSDQINFLSACFWSPWKQVCLHCVLTSSFPLKMIPKSDKGIFCGVTVSYLRMKFILVNTKLIIFMIKLTITQYLFQHPIKANTVLAQFLVQWDCSAASSQKYGVCLHHWNFDYAGAEWKKYSQRWWYTPGLQNRLAKTHFECL